MTVILAQQYRGQSIGLTVLDEHSNTVALSVNDKLRVSIGYEGQDPLFTVTSGTPTANGSMITLGSPSVLRLDASDLTMDPGVYTLFVDHYDYSDRREWRNVDRQVFCLQGVFV